MPRYDAERLGVAQRRLQRAVRGLLRDRPEGVPLEQFSAWVKARGYLPTPILDAVRAGSTALGIEIVGEAVKFLEDTGRGGQPSEPDPPAPPQTNRLSEVGLAEEVLRLALMDSGAIQAQPRRLSPEEEAVAGELLGMASTDLELERVIWVRH